jgi:hypothetical protein
MQNNFMKNPSLRMLGVATLLFAVLVSGLTVFARPVTERGPTRSGRSGRLDEADRNAVKSLIMHDIGNVRMTLANWGESGNPDNAVGFSGFEFPINSGNDFLFSGGPWVGAIVNGEKLVSTATDGDNGTNEFYPIHVQTVPLENQTSSADWYVTSKNYDRDINRFYVLGTKELDDDNDWVAADDKDGDGKPSKNYDRGGGAIGVDDDGDDRIDEDSVAVINGEYVEIDADNDGNYKDTGLSGDINRDGNCAYDPEPHIDEDPAGDMSNDYVDNDFDGLVDLADPNHDGDRNLGFDDDDNDGEADEDGVARGAQEYFCVFQDDIEPSFVGNMDAEGHTPLKIQVLQRTYAFPEAYASAFILLDYRIRNVGQLPLKNTYIAMFADPDIIAAGEGGDAGSSDDKNYYDAGRLMAVHFDDQGSKPGIFAIRVVKTPVALDRLKVTFRNFNRQDGGDPANNTNKYDLMASGDISPVAPDPKDWRMLIAFGDRDNDGFEVPPGGELPITVAYIAGYDTADAGKNAEWALKMYLNDFQGPSAPIPPEFDLDVYEDRVRIRWAPNSENSVDAITSLLDFEGYIVERSNDQLSWETIKAYDKIDTLLDPFQRQNYNLGMPTDTLWVNDTTFQYAFTDAGLIPGHTYYYCVRAFDQGVEGAGVLFSGRTGNVKTAIVARDATTGAPSDLDHIYVYPNPYKGSHRGEGNRADNSSTGLTAYPRKLVFVGLPADGNCIIRIYSLAGDHLATIDHTNGTEYDQWDLITKNKQEIVSGIYYFTVEYRKPSGGTDYHVDKFVVIK